MRLFIYSIIFIGSLCLTALPQAPLFGGKVPQAGQSGANIPAGVDLYALDADNTLWLKRSCDPDFRRMIRVRPFLDGESLIGIDFRPADGNLYALSDTGNLYLVDVTPPGRGNQIRISAVNPRFAGGFQSLLDFNPVVDAIRLIGTNDQNYAVVNSGGLFNAMAVQTRIAYAAGDVNAGIDANLTGGAYTNNVAGAQLTLFYGLDYDLDVLVTIAAGANGSSATGGGQLTTIGKLRRFDGNPLNITPAADMDIYTDGSGKDTLIGITGRTLFTLELNGLPPGQDVTVRTSTLNDGGLIDVAAVKANRRGCN